MIHLILLVSLIPLAYSGRDLEKTVCNTNPCTFIAEGKLKHPNMRVEKREADPTGEQIVRSPIDAEMVSVNFINRSQESLQNRDLGAFIKAVSAAGAHISGPSGVAVIAGISNLGTVLAKTYWRNPSFESVLDAQRKQTINLNQIAGQLNRTESPFIGHLEDKSLIQMRREIVNLLKFWMGVKEENARANTILSFEFVRMCQLLAYPLFPLVFRNELIIDNRAKNSGLAKKYIDDLDQNRYLLFAGTMFLDFAEAVTLQHECTSAVLKNSQALNSTLEFNEKQTSKFWKAMQIEIMNADETFQKNLLNQPK